MTLGGLSARNNVATIIKTYNTIKQLKQFSDRTGLTKFLSPKATSSVSAMKSQLTSLTTPTPSIRRPIRSKAVNFTGLKRRAGGARKGTRQQPMVARAPRSQQSANFAPVAINRRRRGNAPEITSHVSGVVDLGVVATHQGGLSFARGTVMKTGIVHPSILAQTKYSALVAAFEEYRFDRVTLEYNQVVGTETSGSLVLYIDNDSGDWHIRSNSAVQDALEHKSANSGAVWGPIKANRTKTPRWLPVYPDINSSPRDHIAATYHVISNGGLQLNKEYGYLQLRYSLSLRNPTSANYAGSQAFVDTRALAAEDPFAFLVGGTSPNPLVTTNHYLIRFISGNFPILIMEGWHGDGVGGLSEAPPISIFDRNFYAAYDSVAIDWKIYNTMDDSFNETNPLLSQSDYPVSEYTIEFQSLGAA